MLRSARTTDPDAFKKSRRAFGVYSFLKRWHRVLFPLILICSLVLLFTSAGEGEHKPVLGQNKIISGGEVDPSTQPSLTKGSKRFFSIPESKSTSALDVPLASFDLFNESVVAFKERIKDRMHFSQHSPEAKNTIFVSIPSYRDSLCPQTLRKLFQSARNPQNIFVGVCDQLDTSWDQPCEAPEAFRNQVRTVRVPHLESRGPTLARYIISKLWDGEEFYFLLDAHTNFIQDWDIILIDMMRRLPSNKSLVTHYPVGEDKLLGHNKFNHLPVLCKGKFGAGSPKHMLLQECEDCRAWNKQPGNLTCPSIFIGAGFTFGRSLMISDAPYDRYLPWLFQGEEILMAARLWTSGWDFFGPTTNVVSHVYGFRNHSVFSEAKAVRSDEATNARVRYLLGVNQELPPDRRELAELGMGSERTLQEYLDFAGVDLVKQTQIPRCHMRYEYDKKKWVPASSTS